MLLLLVLLMPATVFAYDFEVDGIYYNINGNDVAVTCSDSWPGTYSGAVVIPATVTYSGTTYSVTSIDDFAFSDCTGLASIFIPNSVTSIGEDAFRYCRGLTSIVIPNSVTSIGDHAFRECTGLTSIVVPNSVTSIGGYAFWDCTGLTSIVIPNSITSIGDVAFRECTGLTDAYCYIADLSRVSSGNNQFYLADGDYSGRTLHVLQGMAAAYRADVNWYPYFGQIVDDLKPDVPGDVNGDLEVNIADVNAVTDIILGGSGDPSAADVNGDGEINIADINALINIILGATERTCL